jgi:hypothetical protein
MSSRARANAERFPGLITQTLVLPTESVDDYNRYVQSFADEWNPQGPTELHLVQTLIDTAWRLNRVVMLETNVLALTCHPESQVRSLAMLSMHSQRLTRQFERTLAQLRALQQSRKPQKTLKLPQPVLDGLVFSEVPIAATAAVGSPSISAPGNPFDGPSSHQQATPEPSCQPQTPYALKQA